MDAALLAQLVESGDTKDPISRTPDEVPIHHLDFDFVEQCENVKELKNILELLRSGKEGRYPDLERAVETRMVSLLPETTRSKYEALRRGESAEERSEAKSDLHKWLQEAVTADSSARSGTGKPMPQPRNIVSSGVATSYAPQPVHPPTVAPPTGATSHTNKAAANAGAPADVLSDSALKRDSKAEPFNSYYKRWDTFDIEGALGEMESSNRGDSKAQSVTRATPNVPTAATPAPTAAVTSQASSASAGSGGSDVEAAKREKIKGNEAINSGDSAEAIKCYTRSLKYDHTSPAAAVVYANRAQAHLNTGAWVAAEADCDAAIERNSGYLKAWMRRGNVRMKRGKYSEAASDFEYARSLDTTGAFSVECGSMAAEARRKLSALGGDSSSSTTSTTAGSAGSTASSKPKSRKIVIEEDEEEEPDVRKSGTNTATAVASPTVPVAVAATSTASANSGSNAVGAAAVAGAKSDTSTDTVIAAPVTATTTTATTNGTGSVSNHTRTPTPALTAELTYVATVKEAGNEEFSRGAYAKAADLYSLGIESLPPNAAHMASTLLSNRAFAWVKLATAAPHGSPEATQAARSAVSDCTLCLLCCGIRMPGEHSVLAKVGDKDIADSQLLATATTPQTSFAIHPCCDALSDGGNGVSSTALSRILHDTTQAATLALAIQDTLLAASHSGGITQSLVSVAVKALHRRGAACELLGDLAAAWCDYAAALALESYNERVSQDMRRVKAQARVTTGVPTAKAAPATAGAAPAPLSVASGAPVAGSVSAPTLPVTTTTPSGSGSSGSAPIDARKRVVGESHTAPVPAQATVTPQPVASPGTTTATTTAAATRTTASSVAASTTTGPKAVVTPNKAANVPSASATALVSATVSASSPVTPAAKGVSTGASPHSTPTLPFSPSAVLSPSGGKALAAMDVSGAVARAVAAGTSRQAPITPPKTALEFETQVTKRKSELSSVYAYLRGAFPAAASLTVAFPAGDSAALYTATSGVLKQMAALFKRPMELDIALFCIEAIAQVATTATDGAAALDTAWCAMFLSGLARSPGWHSSYKMLSESEKRVVKVCVEAVIRPFEISASGGGSDSMATAAAELRAAYLS